MGVFWGAGATNFLEVGFGGMLFASDPPETPESPEMRL
jgi:hypothetical protein